MTCKHCGTEIAAKALICYRCGHATTEPRVKPPADGPLFDRPRRSRSTIVLIVIVLVILLGLALWLLGVPPDATTNLHLPGLDVQLFSFTPSEMCCSVSPMRPSLPSLTARSPIETMPTSRSFSTTGRRRT